MEVAPLYTAITVLFGLVLSLHKAQLNECERQGKALQRQINALIQGRPDLAVESRDSDQHAVVTKVQARIRRLRKSVGLVLVLVPLLGIFSCGSTDDANKPRTLATVPAQVHAEDLGHRREAAAIAAAEATGRGDQVEATRQQALAHELGKLEREAQARATAERKELADQIAIERARVADEARIQQAADDRRRVMIVAGLGIAAAAGAAWLLWYLGLPRLLYVGAPGALTIVCVLIAGWASAGPVLGYVLGGMIVLAVLAAAGFASYLIAHLVRQWSTTAGWLRVASPDAATAADLHSLSLQAKPVKWVMNHLLHKHAAQSVDTEKKNQVTDVTPRPTGV